MPAVTDSSSQITKCTEANSTKLEWAFYSDFWKQSHWKRPPEGSKDSVWEPAMTDSWSHITKCTERERALKPTQQNWSQLSRETLFCTFTLKKPSWGAKKLSLRLTVWKSAMTDSWSQIAKCKETKVESAFYQDPFYPARCVTVTGWFRDPV